MFISQSTLNDLIKIAYSHFRKIYSSDEDLFEKVEQCCEAVSESKDYPSLHEYVDATIKLYELSLNSDESLTNLINQL